MKLNHSISMRAAMLVGLILTLSLVSSHMRADTPIPGDVGTCNGSTVTIPFTDVGSSIFFCDIAEAYFSGLTFGTKPVQYSPSAPTPRDQMSAFVARTLDQSVKRSVRRTAMRQTWTTQTAANLGLTDLTDTRVSPFFSESDGADLWVASNAFGTVSRVRASDGKLLDTWTGATNAYGVLVAMGKVFITGQSNPGNLYQIDPTLPPGAVTTLSSTLGDSPHGISFDGQRIWVATFGGVSIVTLNPVTVTTVTTGFTSLVGVIFDGTNIWVTDTGDNKLKKLNPDGSIALSVSVGNLPEHPAFDGINIWVPNSLSNTVSVVRATGGLSGTLLATLTGNGLSDSMQAAFDGERILVTNYNTNSVSLWRASDLTAIASFPTGASTNPLGVCSDGVNFWITLQVANKLARY